MKALCHQGRAHPLLILNIPCLPPGQQLAVVDLAAPAANNPQILAHRPPRGPTRALHCLQEAEIVATLMGIVCLASETCIEERLCGISSFLMCLLGGNAPFCTHFYRNVTKCCWQIVKYLLLFQIATKSRNVNTHTI